MRGLFFALLSASLPLTNCLQRLNPQPCTALYAYGVSATVKSAATGAPIGNATLTLRDGDYVETMQFIPTGDYVGAGERAGTYTLTAQAPGFATKTVDNIVVTQGECHVNGVHVDVNLDPSP